MFRNYFKLAVRNLSRQKAFSFINISGLAVGLASSLIISADCRGKQPSGGGHSGSDGARA